ncbi:MAG: AAA family ATPase [Clostridia bacterium]|nr:AAA family ATPase [Clostridia bacterium]
MVYLKKFILPSDHAEIEVIKDEKRTCFNTFYPFKIFPPKELRAVELDQITMFYGGNGSGKSTLINVMARKVNACRYSDFNDAPLFDKFVGMCHEEYYRYPRGSFVLTSDDVFNYSLNARSVNEKLDEKRDRLFERYIDVHHGIITNPEMGKLTDLDDYERWSEVREILSPKHSQSSYIRKRVARDVDLYSNGETALQYFIDRIDEDALYFLDEPENSLSIERQIELAEYITASARATRSQFIIATHSPIFLSMKNAMVYNLDECPACVSKWTDLPNVRKYFEFFMEHREEFN